MAERDFITAERPRLIVQMSAAHFCAEVAGVAVGFIRNAENIRLKNRHGDFEQTCVIFNLSAVFGAVAGIHYEVDKLKVKIAVPEQKLHKLCKEHRVLSARDTNGDFVSLFNQLVFLDRHNKLVPNLLAVFFCNASLRFLAEG